MAYQRVGDSYEQDMDVCLETNTQEQCLKLLPPSQANFADQILDYFSKPVSDVDQAVSHTTVGVAKWTTGKTVATVGIAALVGYLLL